jgi:uracil-DNA glycosylase
MSWQKILKEESEKEYFKNIFDILKEESKKYEIYPPRKDIFNGFKLCSPDDAKVVFLGMDPYHNPGEAHGLAFSVNHGIKVPPSLRNIFKELKADLAIDIPTHGNLEAWAKQGVLLLNAALTVRKNEPGSHQKIGWSVFTNKVISFLNEKDSPTAFVLWGNFARQKRHLITNEKHLVIESSHPSPLSAYNGFFGSRPFSKVNNFLIENNLDPIDWRI